MSTFNRLFKRLQGMGLLLFLSGTLFLVPPLYLTSEAVQNPWNVNQGTWTQSNQPFLSPSTSKSANSLQQVTLPSWTYPTGFDPHGPFIDRLVWKVYPTGDIDGVIEALENGIVDGYDERIPFDRIDEVNAVPGVTVHTSLSNMFRQFTLHCENFPTNITGYRRALALALDKFIISEYSTDGLAQPMDGAVPISDPRWNFENEIQEHFYEEDMVSANSSLEAAGFIDLDGDGWREYDRNNNFLWDAGTDIDDSDLTIELIATSNYDPAIQAVLVLIEGMEKCGLHGILLELSFTDMLDLIYSGDYNLACFTWTQGPPGGGWFYHDMFRTDSLDNELFFRFHNATYDALADALMNSVTYEEALDYAWDCQQILLEQMPMITCYNDVYSHAFRTDNWDGYLEMAGQGVMGPNPYTLRRVQRKPEANGPYGGTYTNILSEGMDTKNPLVSGLIYTTEIFDQIYDRLWAVEPQTWEPQPSLAKDWIIEETFASGDIQDGMKFTFYLFPNATWHDGAPVTSEDVKFSLEYLWPQSPESGEDVSHIYRIETTDAHTVIIYSDFKSHFEFERATYHYILPKHVWIHQGPEFTAWEPQTARDLTGSGPFKWITREPDVEIVLERHPYYHLAIDRAFDLHGPYIDELIWQFYPDGNYDLALHDLKARRIDGFAGSLPYDQAYALTNTMGAEVTSSPNNAYRLLALHCDNFPTNISRFRRAMALALDKYEVCDRATQGQAVPMDGALPLLIRPWNFENQMSKHLYTKEILAADSILNIAGFIDLDGDGWREYDRNHNSLWDPGIDLDDWDLAIDMIALLGYAPSVQTVIVQSECLEACGIRSNIIEADIDEFLDRLVTGNYHAVCFSRVIETLEGVNNYYNFFRSGQSDNEFFFQFHNATYDALVDAMMSATTYEQTHNYAWECQKILLEQMPMITCYNDVNLHAHRVDTWEHWINMASRGVTEDNHHSYTHVQISSDLGGPLGGTLHMGIEQYDLHTTNIFNYEAIGPPNTIFECLYDTLWQLNPYNWELMPRLAYDWAIEETVASGPIQDGVKFTFSLYPNATWHDGTPLTSEDVKYSYETIWAAHWSKGQILSNIYRIETPNPHTVIIYSTETNYIEFLSTTNLYILPKHIWQLHEPDFTAWEPITPEELVGSGPFKVTSYTPQVQLVMEAHTLYHFGFDRTPPTWDQPPSDQFIELGAPLSYDLDASDPLGIDTWWIDETNQFDITDEGVIFNIAYLSVASYTVHVYVNDSLGNTLSGLFHVIVQDTTPPEWLEVPGDQFLRYGESVDLILVVLDWSASLGLQWYLDDSTDFYLDINLPWGNVVHLRSSDILDVGVYKIEITVADYYGNTQTIEFSITIYQRIQLTLSGSFDYLLRENIHIQIAGLLINPDTNQPISGATIECWAYTPDGNLLLQFSLTENLDTPGVYIYTSPQTIKQLNLPKGIYLIYGKASLTITDDIFEEAIDMLQFHIDPPEANTLDSLLTTLILALSTISAIGITIIFIHIRRMKRPR